MADHSRLAIRQVECLPYEGQWRLRVTISHRDNYYQGEAIAVTEEYQFEAVAMATLEAINHALPQQVRVVFTDAGQLFSSKANMTLFVVIIEIYENDHKSFISGSSLLFLPILHAPAKAVLNSVNRRLQKYFH